MRGLAYPSGHVFDTLERIGFTDVELVLFRVHSTSGVHPCVLARKPRMA
jgi:hypothetical protein